MRRVIRFGGKAYALLLTLPLLAGALVSLWLIAIDPLDRRPWGDPPRLAPINYPSIVLPAQIRREQNVVLVGTSAALGAGPELIARNFGVSKAANLSYAKAYPADSDPLLAAAIETPGLKRLILEVGHTWLFEDRASDQPGRRMLSALSTDWFGLPEFDQSIILAENQQRQGRTFSFPDWEQTNTRYAPDQPSVLPAFQKERIRKAAREQDLKLFALPPVTADCSAASRFAARLPKVLARAAERRILVDIYFPPIAFSAYPLMQQLIGTPHHRPNLFKSLMQLQRCTLGLVNDAGYNGAAVHAVGAKVPFVGSEAGLRDPFHYGGTAAFSTLLTAIRDKQYPLTEATFPAYQQALQDQIVRAAKAYRQ